MKGHGKKEGIRALLIGAGDEENLSIRYLAAALEQAGHDAVIMPCSRMEDVPRIVGKAISCSPGLVGISIAFQSLAHVYFTLVEELRAKGYRGVVIAGGHFPTFEYRRILENQRGVDYVGRFEGERTIVELADFIQRRIPLEGVTNLVYRANGGIRENACNLRFPDLDALPFPKRDAGR